ncbi:MAG: hypothetical protein IE909_04695 [Campylobacterales bacterium]|nr:hypothetical protein [Campylobacterales bacterium]
MFEKLKLFIIDYIYNISKQPVKLHELLSANQRFQEGMKLDGSKLGFRIKVGRAYVVFLILAHLIILPLALISHHIFVHLDCHASIISAIFFTAFLFGIFNFFKEWTQDCVTKQRIKQMWILHFPHFPFEEYAKDVAKIYEDALKQEIKHSDLERFILDRLSQ